MELHVVQQDNLVVLDAQQQCDAVCAGCAQRESAICVAQHSTAQHSTMTYYSTA